MKMQWHATAQYDICCRLPIPYHLCGSRIVAIPIMSQMSSPESLLSALRYQIVGKVTIFASKIAPEYRTAGGYPRFKVPCCGDRLSTNDPTKLAEILTAILDIPITPEQCLACQDKDSTSASAGQCLESRLCEPQVGRGPLYWELTSLTFARGETAGEVSVSGAGFLRRFSAMSESQKNGWIYRVGPEAVTFVGVRNVDALAEIVGKVFETEGRSVANFLNIGSVFQIPPYRPPSRPAAGLYVPPSMRANGGWGLG
jgi:hypothetical protein